MLGNKTGQMFDFFSALQAQNVKQFNKNIFTTKQLYHSFQLKMLNG